MAENEYLDSSKARRWQSVAQAIQERLDLAEVTERAKDCFYKTLRSIAKDLPFAEMISSAVRDPSELETLCGNVQGGLDVKDFLLRAARTTTDVENMLRTFLTDALNNCLYDIPYIAAKLDGEVSISQARSIVQSAAQDLRPEIQRMAQKFAADPHWSIRRNSARRSDASQRDRTKEMLAESLIAGFKK